MASTSTHRSWRYVPAQALPCTDRVLATPLDMRLPLTFSLGDCNLIGNHGLDAVAALPLERVA